MNTKEFWLDVFNNVRGSLLLTFAIIFISISILSWAQPNRRFLDTNESDVAKENEHRFTALETKVDSMQHDISDIRGYGWIQIIGLSGLMGEAGIRIIKKPGGLFKKEDPDEGDV